MSTEQDKQAHARRQLAWIRKNTTQETIELHRERQLRQSLDIMNQLINENAHRPESIRLLRKILRERSELQILRGQDEISLSG